MPLMISLILKKKTEELIVSDNIGLSLGDLKDIMDTNTKQVIDIIYKIQIRSERKMKVIQK